MDAINTESYKDKIEKTLLEYEFSLEDISFVDVIEDEDNPLRILKVERLGRTDNFKILLLKSIPHDTVCSVKDVIKHHGFTDNVEQLKDEWLFLKHALLHEICHILYRHKFKAMIEKECDRWAFEKMGFKSH